MRRCWVVAALCLAGACAQAQDTGGIARRLTPEQIAEIGLTARQIELLDRYLGEAVAASPPVEAARYEGAQGAPRDPTALLGLQEGPIHGRLTHDVAGWEPGTVFVLDNGQQWKVLKGSMRLRQPLATPEVQVVPGIAGRWFLQVHEDLPKARVYRID